MKLPPVGALLGLLALLSSRVGISSWYGAAWDGEETANGETFDHERRTLAHKDWPLGHWCLLVNLQNLRLSVAWLNDRGPYIEGREFDVSERVAEDLGFIEAGTARLFVLRF